MFLRFVLRLLVAVRLSLFVRQSLSVGLTLALFVTGSVRVHADNQDIVAASRNYLNLEEGLNAEDGQQGEPESVIAEYDGDVDAVIRLLSESAETSREDVSGVLANQHFTDPRLLQRYSDDLLHFYVPEDYSPSRPYGLLIFMHGGGPRTPREDPVHVVTDPDDDPQSNGFQPYFRNLPFIIVAPSAPWNEKTGARWNVEGADEYITAVIEECGRRFHIDRDRVVLGGYSMGGFGAFHLCQRLADRLAGGVVFSGAWKTTNWKAWTGLPLFMRHGALDACVKTDSHPGRPRYTDVFFARAAAERLSELGQPHVYVEDDGGHAIAGASEAFTQLADWIVKQKRDPFARHVVAISPRGWKESTDTPAPHRHWITIHETGDQELPFDKVVMDGPRPTRGETQEAFDQQTFRLEDQPVKAGLVDATVEDGNRIVIHTQNVRKFSVWLHPSMVDFSRPVLVSVNGQETGHTVKPTLLNALRSYQRRGDWGLIYHAEISLTADE
jgi:predicted esterase